MSCEVCDGTPGAYPIHNKFGRHLYDIECPECFGSGLSEVEFELKQQQETDRAKYEAAMKSTRSAGSAEQAPASD